ncbi:hypothetical protein M4951_18775 [Blastopirellula sp. J2-11]|uniref:hypothetical protein n=1 Tax=Blastopirellula sp. J2-11 TaxID=2943192 RepID=UPI0021C83977|nr:hypothetical protein [Blastopirellula sp. J2-11]UUO05412.1 hypothetical protein M4951_18775 [Blastopirellula sp. J2-11]
MKTAAIYVSIIFALMEVAIGAGLILGFGFGVISMQGTEVTIHWDSSPSGRNPYDRNDVQFHNFYATTSIYFFVALLTVPLALLAIIATALFSRSSKRESQHKA